MTPGLPDLLLPGLTRVLAPNPGVMTGPGTNTYLVGVEALAVIDPGPLDDSHTEAIVAAAGRRPIRWILATHTHSDHSPGCAPLAERTGAEVLGFGPAEGFNPSATLADGDVVDVPGFALTAVHTPGHASNHLCFRLASEGVLFSGDHIMNGSTVVIAPPDGDMAAYLESLRRLRAMPISSIAPAHGPLIVDPAGAIDAYLVHRLARESSVLDALRSSGPQSVSEIVSRVYTDVPEARHPIARYSVWAHLRKLAGDGLAASDDDDSIDAVWSPA